MYMKVKKIKKLIRMEFPEKWDQDDFEIRLKALEEWNRIRNREALNLEKKAKIFKYAIYSTLFFSVINGILMLVAMIFLANGGEGYHAAMVFEILMLLMLALHIVLVFFRWMWFKTLDELALIVPVEYE